MACVIGIPSHPLQSCKADNSDVGYVLILNMCLKHLILPPSLFLSVSVQIRWEKNITLGEPPGFLHSWWWWVFFVPCNDSSYIPLLAVFHHWHDWIKMILSLLLLLLLFIIISLIVPKSSFPSLLFTNCDMSKHLQSSSAILIIESNFIALMLDYPASKVDHCYSSVRLHCFSFVIILLILRPPLYLL